MMPWGGGLDTDSRTAWISQGFERLIHRVRQAPAEVHFDVIVIGSGYGGAIAAATFAGRQQGGEAITVGVLERGKEYLPGSFPTGLGELPGHIRQDHNKEGLFDIRLAGEVTTVIANGVGGGSLINAGVMEVPAPSVFTTGWPSALKNLSTWTPYFDRARDLSVPASMAFPTRSSTMLTVCRRSINRSVLSHPPANFVRPRSRSR
jgi:cholesterol oxidase